MAPLTHKLTHNKHTERRECRENLLLLFPLIRRVRRRKPDFVCRTRISKGETIETTRGFVRFPAG